MENPITALLFGNNPDIALDERARVLTELYKIGSLTFEITTSGDGWVAQCKEVPGIIAGGTNINPSNSEIESQIRDSIFAAFDVKTSVEGGSQDFQTSPFFTYNDFGRNNSSHVLA